MGDSGNADFYRYYAKTDSYAVNFSNKESLSAAAVEALFSKYGVIRAVRQTGTATGYCVVEFAEKSSAMKCIADVQGRKPITLRKFVPLNLRVSKEERKDNRNGDKKHEVKSNTTWGSARLEAARNDTRRIRRIDDAAGNENVDSQLSNSKTKEHSSMESIGSSSYKPTESPISPENDQKDENLHKIEKHHKNKNDDEDENNHKNEDFGKICDNSKKSSIVTSNNDSNDDNQKKTPVSSEDQERTSQPHHPVSEKNPLRSIKIPKRPPKLVLRKPKSFSDNVFYSISQGRVSPVALKKPWQEEPVEHVIAQEVIVGNIDLKCDIQFILDLFEEHEPLLASSMRLDEKNSFQCCHVYFKTKWQAAAAESRWDNAEVRGRNIIVLRAETLAEFIR